MDDLLFLAHRMPYPPDKGEKIRAYHVLRHLARTFRIHLGCFADDRNDLKYAAHLREYCASVFVAPLDRKLALARGLAGLAIGGSLSESYFRNARMRHWVAETVARVRPANIFVYCSAMAPYAMPYASSHRVLLDMVDVDSEKFRAYGANAAWPLSQLYAREARALFSLERRAAMTFERCFFVSGAEADTFLRAAPEAASRVGHFQNGVDLNYFDPTRDFANPFAPESAAIVFTGTMDYRPNVEAVEWFAGEVFPAVRRTYPNAQFWIVGSNPSPRVARLARMPGVHMTGRVPDVRPFLAHAACAVAPLHIARGLQNKMLEAMAMGKPVVATPAACQGLSAAAGRDVLLAETPPDFAQAVCSILRAGVHDLGVNARLRVEADYDWGRNLQVLDGYFHQASEKRSARETMNVRDARTEVMGTAS
jgi:sugar transferase (PEP-CTERM/EpsH1 system associated)